jgi:hypothetical protein
VNPIIEYCEIIISGLGSFKANVQKEGKDVVAEYKSIQEIKNDYYTTKVLSPKILKQNVAE